MTPDSTRQKIFVEGSSDGAVINKLILLRLRVDLGRPKSHQIVDAPLGDGGFDGALGRFVAALEARRPEQLGLVVDRDGGDKPDRWPAVRDAIRRAGLPAAEAPPRDGVRIQASWGRVGVWLMPDNNSVGDLESFLETMVPEPRPPTWGYATEATEHAKQLGAPYRNVSRPKAVLHTWLSWQEPPGNPYGTAIEAGMLGPSSAAADAFIDWFRWLFELEPPPP